MGKFFVHLLLLFCILSCSDSQDEIYTSFGDAYDNMEDVIHFQYDPSIIDHEQVYSEIPDFVCQFPALKSFEMSNANLTNIPECICEIKTLKKLIIEGNDLIYLPNNLGNLENLKYLSLVGNQLQNIPESIGDLNNLKKLYLRGNQLKTLPNSIKNLTELLTLDLAYNNFNKSEKDKIESWLPNCEIIWE